MEGGYNLDALHQLFSQDKHINSLIQQLADVQYDSQLITGLTGSARPVLIHSLFKELKKPLYIFSPNLLQAQKLVEDLTALLGEDFVHYYPAEEFIAADLTVSSPELRAERIATIGHLINNDVAIYVIPIAGMRKIMTPVEQWKTSFLRSFRWSRY